MDWMHNGALLGSVVFALFGVLIFWVCFIVIDKLTPYNLWEEIVEKAEHGAGAGGGSHVAGHLHHRRGCHPLSQTVG